MQLQFPPLHVHDPLQNAISFKFVGLKINFTFTPPYLTFDTDVLLYVPDPLQLQFAVPEPLPLHVHDPLQKAISFKSVGLIINFIPAFPPFLFLIKIITEISQ